MPGIVYQIINLVVSLIRYLGMAVFGVAVGWLVLDLLKKAQAWQVEIAIFLGLMGLVIALAYFLSGSVGAFVIGLAVAIFIWGLPKKSKEEKSE